MGEGYLHSFITNAKLRLFFWFTFFGLLLVATYWIITNFITDDAVVLAGSLAFAALLFGWVFAVAVGNAITKPTKYIAEAIQHVAPGEHLVEAPNVEELTFGRELVSILSRQVYSYASHADTLRNDQEAAVPSGIFDQLPVALIGLDENRTITLANNKAIEIAQSNAITGLPFDEIFGCQSEDESFADWLNAADQNTLTAVKTFQKVAVSALHTGTLLGYYDLAVSFNKHSATGVETLITLYDHTQAYEDESDSVGFVAMAVHELRTPVTILRGYLEAFSEDLAERNDQTFDSYISKMNASADGLASFITNILNVAKINQGQLSLTMQEGNWNQVLPSIVDNLRGRAAAAGKTIELRMENNLPPVAIDRMTISEVITNLVDNSIKYSPNNNDPIKIVSKINSEGWVETTVEDHGVGIPEGVMPHLFSKFSRNHRNKNQIGGTGLGLYLSKAIITAHNSNIWASSKEGEGSTFGFTLVPYEQLAKDLENNNNENIVRTSHGWIKNHSMQRR